MPWVQRAITRALERQMLVSIEDNETHSVMVPHGLEPRTLRLLAVRSDQLSYETLWKGRKDSERK